MAQAQQSYHSVSIERRGYGRRYTWLPVDQLSREGFSIDFTNSLLRPDGLDIRVDDVARWQEGGRYVEGRIVEVRREAAALHVRLADTHLLPPEAFHP